jgi:hypothetical protein
MSALRELNFRLLCWPVAALLAAGSAAGAPAPRTIPWTAERPPTVSAVPPRLAAPCTPAALRARIELQGATGSLVGGVDLVNVGARACSLTGRPQLAFTGPAARTTPWRVTHLARSPAPIEVLEDPISSLRAVRPGKAARIFLAWSNWCGPGAQPTGSPGRRPDALRLTLPGGGRIALPLAHAPRCDAPGAPSLLSAGPYAPALRTLPQSSRLPLQAEIVAPRPVRVKPGLRALAARPGVPLHYAVALTNTGRRAFRFHSCPVYQEQLVPAPARAYVLNCKPVGELRPGATAVFEMRVPVPANAPPQAGLSWELAPKTYEPPFATAAVAIR